MSGDEARSNGGSPRGLDPEMRTDPRAITQLDSQRECASAFERLATAVIPGDDIEKLLREWLQLLVDVLPTHVAVIRLREGDRLRARVSIGLDDEVASGFSVPIDADYEKAVTGVSTARWGAVPPADPSWSEFIRRRGVRRLIGVPLVGYGRLFGVLYMGALDEEDTSEDSSRLLRLAAVRLAAAIAYYTVLEAVRSRDDVLAVVAHDLRNPIGIISLSANVLLQRLPDSTARRPVERIVRATQRADRLVRDLLEVDAIETGRFSIEPRQSEPTNLVLSALESQQGLAADASVIIATDLSPKLPMINADEERLHQVLENLIGNAVKFTAAGGSVTVGAKAQEDAILFWVADSGSGIPPEQLPHIFDRFWQAPKAKRRGAGLGLNICKGIVEAHAGRIWAESTVGVGTTLFFTIPSIRERAPSDPRVEVASILLVDDRPENLLALTAILERPDYRLVTATSGEEALRAALREHFAVALIDIAMPVMNGLDVAVHLKELERSRDVPIIFITAFGSDPEEIHRAYSAGGVDYLVKPLDTEIVRKKVAVFVDLSRRNRGVARPRVDTRDSQ